MEARKEQKLIRDIVESAYDQGADMSVTPCPLCQANRDPPAYGGSAKDAGLDGQVIRAPKLEAIAVKSTAASCGR